jgi:hypothetical protein
MASVNVDKLSLKELLDLEGKLANANMESSSKILQHSPRSAASR